MSADTHKPQETSSNTPLCVSRYGYGYMLSAAQRLPLSLHYNSFYKRMVMGYVNCKNFRMFYIAHKVTNTPYLAWSQYWKGATPSALPFKASHLSSHQCGYSFGKKEQWLFATHETAFVFMDCLKYFETNSYPGWLEGLMGKWSTSVPYNYLLLWQRLEFVDEFCQCDGNIWTGPETDLVAMKNRFM